MPKPEEEGALVVLCSHNESDIGRVFYLADGSRTLLGRSDSCECMLQESSVSRVHFSIECEEGKYYVHDRCSTFGTYLNNDSRPIEREPLHSGDRIRAGGVVLKYFRGDDVEGKVLQALHQLAFADALTGCLKTEALLSKLRRRLASEPIERVAAFSVEIRDLALIKQKHGAIAGDMVLSELAQRIRAVAGPDNEGHVARIGAGRFLAFKLQSSRMRVRDPLPAVERELRRLPISVNGQSVYPELVVQAVDALECATTAPHELSDRLQAGELCGKGPKTTSGVISLGRLDTDAKASQGR